MQSTPPWSTLDFPFSPIFNAGDQAASSEPEVIGGGRLGRPSVFSRWKRRKRKVESLVYMHSDFTYWDPTQTARDMQKGQTKKHQQTTHIYSVHI